MSVRELTAISYCFGAMAVFFIAASTVMFFKFDIRKAWKLTRERKEPNKYKQNKAVGKALPAALETASIGTETTTQKIDTHIFMPQGDRTVPLDVGEFILVQDITYTHD